MLDLIVWKSDKSYTWIYWS